jgi:hypothetical protein
MFLLGKPEMIIAEFYVHLYSEADNREQQERFGRTLHEYAVGAAQYFLGDCEIEVIVEEGSTKGKVRVRRLLTGMLMFYGAAADYESFCKQVGVMYANTEWFLKTMATRVQYGEVPDGIYDRRAEKRHKTTGKLKHLAELVLELNDAQHQMSAKQFQEKTEELIARLGDIQKEVSDEEMRHLLNVLSLENFRGPTREPLDIFRSPNILHRPRSKEEESHQFAFEIESHDGHRVGETRVVPSPKRIFEKQTQVKQKDPPKPSLIQTDRPALYPPTRQLDLD